MAPRSLLNAVVTLAVAPGILAHEYAHVLACRALGIGILAPPTLGLTEDALFEHEPVEHFYEDVLVGAAPLLCNSLLAFGAFALAGLGPPIAEGAMLWVGLTFGLTAFPSPEDTNTLLAGARTLTAPLRPAGYAVALSLRSVSASVAVSGVLALVWTAVLYRAAVGL